MVRAGGINWYKVETTGDGRRKAKRYHYKHALMAQMELPL